MTTQQTADLAVVHDVLRYADTDIERFFGCFAEDASFRMGNNDIVQGSDSIMSWVGGYLKGVAGMRHDVAATFFQESSACVELTVTYTMDSGDEIPLPAVVRMTVTGGLIADYRIYMDPSPILAAAAA